MTTISSTGRLYQHTETGIRPFDIGRDLRPVAELISQAFAQELDSRGTAVLREMRVMGYMGGLIRLLNRSTGDFGDIINGYVWVEDGKVVGNVTIQRSDGHSDRWQIVNVAVAKQYRGRGIAGNLLLRALEHIEQSGARWAVLQVYENNKIARTLYQHIGFENLGGTVELRLDRIPSSNIEISKQLDGFRPFGSHEWRALYDIVRSQSTAQSQWWRSEKRSDFRQTFEEQISEWFWRVMGRQRTYRVCIQKGSRFDAALILNAQRWKGDHKIALWMRPEYYGQYEDYFLQWILAQLQEFPRWPLSVTLSTEHAMAQDVFEQFNFRQRPALLTMRKKLKD
ncbi:GNAT family N-acetyltransferase [Chloroflexi bacterium TSY]|nr:GNAT family N-acetyltransferase [Chloroflexi bacterium TSY]